MDVKLASDIVVPVKLDQQKARHLLQMQGVPQSKTIIGTVAAFVPHKDPLTMVQTIKELSKKRTDFAFVHAGTGELESEVKSRIEELGLTDIYFPLGFVGEVENLFSVLDIFVMSSEEEGLGSSVLDAFIYKVPVVGTDAGGLSELLSEGRAIKCPKKDAVALAEGINQMLSDDYIRCSIVQRAYDYVLQKHNLHYITQQYLNIFKREN
jgi:glycosyltransferase involved in cell wall biosynthesis